MDIPLIEENMTVSCDKWTNKFVIVDVLESFSNLLTSVQLFIDEM